MTEDLKCFQPYIVLIDYDYFTSLFNDSLYTYIPLFYTNHDNFILKEFNTNFKFNYKMIHIDKNYIRGTYEDYHATYDMSNIIHLYKKHNFNKELNEIFNR